MIFLYTKDGEPSEESRRLIIEAGYIPVEVKNFDDVQILPPPLPRAKMDAITQAAIETLGQCGESARAMFAKKLCDALLADRKQ